MTDHRLGELEELLLLALHLTDGDASSVRIQRILQDEASRRLSLGAIYAALDRLSRKGFVDSELGDPTPVRGGKARRLYRLTRAGLQAIEERGRVRQAMWTKVGGLSLEPPEAG